MCAHRYISKDGESRYGQGLCYVLDNDLSFDDAYDPCKGRSVQREHEEYAYCQAGTSGTILEDGTMILGTPGKKTVFCGSTSKHQTNQNHFIFYAPRTIHMARYNIRSSDRRTIFNPR